MLPISLYEVSSQLWHVLRYYKDAPSSAAAVLALDCGGRSSDSCAFVLVGLANHAAPDGTGAFPSVKTLMRYTRMSERTVRAALGARGRRADPAV